tara:strand:- start:1303 stop:1626 length:324 start_codon:yes stop_codon:yes gene_type:complete
MKTLLLIPFLFLLTSCGTFSDLSEAITKGNEIVTEINEGLEEAVSIRDELALLEGKSREAADTDGDGELDWMERIAYLLLLGGGGAEMLRRKLKKSMGGTPAPDKVS